jgi:predicted nucleotidyltransferase
LWTAGRCCPNRASRWRAYKSAASACSWDIIPPVKPRRDTQHAEIDPIAERDRICVVLRQHLPELQRRYRVRALWLFGSHARGEPRRRSDIDVLVEFSETPSLLELARLQRELSLLLGKRVDLALKDALKPHIGKRILEEAIPV